MHIIYSKAIICRKISSETKNYCSSNNNDDSFKLFSLCEFHISQSVLTDVVFVSWKTHTCVFPIRNILEQSSYHYPQAIRELFLKLCKLCGLNVQVDYSGLGLTGNSFLPVLN